MAKFVIPTQKQGKVTEVSLEFDEASEEIQLCVLDNDGDPQGVASLVEDGTLTLRALDSYAAAWWTLGGGLIERKNERDYIKVKYA